LLRDAYLVWLVRVMVAPVGGTGVMDLKRTKRMIETKIMRIALPIFNLHSFITNMLSQVRHYERGDLI
jgi:hypothetical protein